MLKAESLGTASVPMTLDKRIQRVQGLRRRALLQSIASTAGWMAGSAGFVLITLGGFLSLR